MKVAIITNMIPPYRVPLFEAIGKEVDLTVLISSPMEENRQWKAWDQNSTRVFNTIFLKGVTVRTRRGNSYVQLDVLRQLHRINPDVIVNSGFGVNSLLGALLGRIRRKKILLWSEATLYSERQSTSLREKYRKWILKLHNGCIAVGKESKRFFFSLGANNETCFLAVDAIPPLAEDALSKARKKSGLIKGQYGNMFLYSGQLIPRKGLKQLLHAWARMENNESHLVFMGTGDEEATLRSISSDLNARNVHFVGWCDGTTKWAYYLACDVFVFPTLHDVWGLVLNEAMMAGKAVISSPFAGASADLVSNGACGYVVDPNDTGTWVKRMTELANDPVKREKMGNASLDRIQNYTIEASAKGFLEAIFESRK